MEDIVKIEPGRVGAEIQIPASKSLCHRAILAAALAEGRSQIDHISRSADIEATLAVARVLGAVVEEEKDSLWIEGIGGRLDLVQHAHQTIDCNESGSTLRFVVPILSALGIPATYHGRGKLGERPMTVYYEIFDRQQLEYETDHGQLPLTVRSRLKPGVFSVNGGISSQFVTGLLMALPLLEGDSEIQIVGTLESRPYVDLTCNVLRNFGIQIEEKAENCFSIPGGQTYQAAHYQVEGDASQAAFFICAGGIAGVETGILIRGLRPDTAQGDLAFLEAFRSVGGRYCWEETGLRVFPSQLQGDLTFDVSQCPDLVPILTVLGCYTKGTMHMIGAGRLRIKESDRLAAITCELNKLGAQVREEEEGLWVTQAKLRGGETESWNDHRIAMSAAIAALGCKQEVVIHGADSVKKSWPTFWDDFNKVKQKYE